MENRKSCLFVTSNTVVVVLAVLFLVTMSFTSTEAAETLKIGGLFGLTGFFSGFDQVQAQEAEVTADIINEGGGIKVKGKQYNIQLITYDFKSTMDGVAAGANKLIFQDGVKFMIAPSAFFSPPTKDIAESNKVIPEDRICAVSTCNRLDVGEFDYFFLVGREPAYELRDAYFGRFRASRLTESRERVGLDELKRDFVSGLEDPDENVRLMQAELIGSSGRKVDAEYLKRLLASSDNLTRATIHYALLRLGDYSTLASIRGFLEATSNVPAVERLRFLCLSQINVIRDAAAVDALVEFAKSPADDVREAAIHALRTIGSARTVSLFVQALDDKVQMIRYDAVLALAEIERNWSLAPSVDAFQADEKKYIAAWKSWWATEGRRRRGP